MADDQLRYMMEHAEELIPVMYDHARMIAKGEYGWREGKTLPLGKTPEEIVTDVYVSYIRGEDTKGTRVKGVRHFNPGKDFMLQLKGSIRSALWALHDRSSTKNEFVARTEGRRKSHLKSGPQRRILPNRQSQRTLQRQLWKLSTSIPKSKRTKTCRI